MNRRRVLALLLAGSLGACAPAGPPRVALGTRCVACSMDVADLRFACERRVGGRWRTYDAIECLLRDAGGAPGAEAWLSDYDTRTLHPADSMWVVRGEFPSPMGGGFAAFTRRGAADSVATLTHGRVERLAAFASGSHP